VCGDLNVESEDCNADDFENAYKKYRVLHFSTVPFWKGDERGGYLFILVFRNITVWDDLCEFKNVAHMYRVNRFRFIIVQDYFYRNSTRCN
jgi:hypothetical protein